ncbi:MAG: hypothetical protein AB7P01_09005 [Bacteroidia bacterium]
MPGKRKLNTQVKAIQYFIEQGDIEMVLSIIDNAPQLDEKTKKDLKLQLDYFLCEFEDSDDTHFTARAGKCKGCFKGCTGFMYTGNVSKKKAALVFKQKDGNIESFKHCAGFALKKIAKSKKKKVVKGKTQKD